jgi:hypothetical protein
MKRTGKKIPPNRVVALALTWDGARWPVRTLPPKARAFLTTRFRELPSVAKMAMLLAADEVKEIRVCWVPRLKGGKAVLSEPFPTSAWSIAGAAVAAVYDRRRGEAAFIPLPKP